MVISISINLNYVEINNGGGDKNMRMQMYDA
jgi:hypothetical protein